MHSFCNKIDELQSKIKKIIMYKSEMDARRIKLVAQLSGSGDKREIIRQLLIVYKLQHRIMKRIISGIAYTNRSRRELKSILEESGVLKTFWGMLRKKKSAAQFQQAYVLKIAYKLVSSYLKNMIKETRRINSCHRQQFNLLAVISDKMEKQSPNEEMSSLLGSFMAEFEKEKMEVKNFYDKKKAIKMLNLLRSITPSQALYMILGTRFPQAEILGAVIPFTVDGIENQLMWFAVLFYTIFAIKYVGVAGYGIFRYRKTRAYSPSMT